MKKETTNLGAKKILIKIKKPKYFLATKRMV